MSSAGANALGVYRYKKLLSSIPGPCLVNTGVSYLTCLSTSYLVRSDMSCLICLKNKLSDAFEQRNKIFKLDLKPFGKLRRAFGAPG